MEVGYRTLTSAAGQVPALRTAWTPVRVSCTGCRVNCKVCEKVNKKQQSQW